MLGWHISVYRQEDGSAPASVRSPVGSTLAVWQTGCDGLRWLKELVQRGKALDLGGGGYPDRYTATASVVLPAIQAGPPLANEPWKSDPGDILLPNWLGKTTIDLTAIERCREDEWLLIEAWDES